MGDGATSEGDFHVALNMAGLRKAPVVFCCQNNQWAISVPGHRQTASKTLAIKARAYGFPGIRVDGNDALAVYAATRDAVNRARAGEGPTLLEFLTYRVGAHSTSDDPSRYRDESITEEWKGRCPVERMQPNLVARGCWTEAEEEALVHTTVADIKDAVKRHENMENPPPSSLFDDVYAVLPWHLEEQRESMMQTLEKPDVR
jgi:TPP-dependent pyruvate/acetoin dehydrogenase alpha subunit